MNDLEHFARLWTKAQPLVSSFISSLMLDRQEAEDVLQNVAVVVVRKLSEYDSNRPFLSWALAIAKREVLMSRRKKARSLLIYRSDTLDEVMEVYEELAPELDVRAQALQECVEMLTAKAALVLRLRYEEGLKPQQISTQLGLPAPNVRMMLNRVEPF